MPRRSKPTEQIRREQRVRARRKLEKTISKYLARSEIHIRANAPTNRTEFIEAYVEHRKSHPNAGVASFIRHNLTDYDEIMFYATKRWRDGVEVCKQKGILQSRVRYLSTEYARQIGVQDLLAKQRSLPMGHKIKVEVTPTTP